MKLLIAKISNQYGSSIYTGLSNDELQSKIAEHCRSKWAERQLEGVRL